MWSERNQREDFRFGHEIGGEAMAKCFAVERDLGEDKKEKSEPRLSPTRFEHPICSCHMELKDECENFLI